MTGLGAVTNIGLDVPSMWRSLIEGRSGVSAITCFQQDDQWSVRIAGEIRGWDPSAVLEHSELKRTDRFCALGMSAAEEAAKDCGIDFTRGDPYRRCRTRSPRPGGTGRRA